MTRHGRSPTSGQRRSPPLRPTGGFLLKFILVWFAALVLFAMVPAIERWFVAATIANVRFLGSVAGVSSQVQGDIVRFQGALPASIASDCTSMLPTTLLWTGILAFPAAFRWKLVGMAAGAAVLWAYNLIRILVMISILKWNKPLVDFIHVFVWQTVTIVIACGLFLLWLRKAAPPRPA